MPFVGPWEALILTVVIGLIIALIIIGLARMLGRKKPTIAPSQKIMVRCPSCKGLNDEDATFCSNCGSKLK